MVRLACKPCVTARLSSVALRSGTMCDSAIWNDETDMLGALMDSKLVVWCGMLHAVFIRSNSVPLLWPQCA
jgi:hypothetical protein